MSDFSNGPPPPPGYGPPPSQGHGPQGYPPQPPGFYQFVQPTRTSGLAIASMVLGIVWIYWIGSILAVIFGHVAISQMNRDPNLRGKGMAIAGLALGYVGLGMLALVIIVAAAASST